MRAPPKWEPGGDMITTYGDFEDAVRAKRVVYVEGFFTRSSPTHVRSRERAVSAVVVGNMSYMLVTQLIQGGKIRRARQTVEYHEWISGEILG